MKNGNSFDKPTVLPLSETQLKEFNENMIAKTHQEKIERHRYRRSTTSKLIRVKKTVNY